MAINPNKSVENGGAIGAVRKDDDVKRKIQIEMLNFLIDNAPKSPKAADQQNTQQKSSEESKAVLQRTIKPEEPIQKIISPQHQQQLAPAGQHEEVTDFFQHGDLVENQFLIEKQLKVGGFGQIYKAIDVKTKVPVAVKVEKNIYGDENVEGFVLQILQGQQNFPKWYAMGTKPQYTFVVMQLLGENLSELRRSCPLTPPRLSMSSAYRTTIQCLRATEGLHELGFLHRDIKPSNFAVGREGGQDRTVIYMLDFGLCRQYLTKNGAVKKPRENAGFRGTVRYASVAAHGKKDLSRRDDLWSLFYTFVELLTGQLPWRKTNDKEEVWRLKVKFSPEVLCNSFPPEIGEFCRHVKGLQYADKPNYTHLMACISRILPKINVNLNDLYDWQMFDCRSVEHWKPRKK